MWCIVAIGIAFVIGMYVRDMNIYMAIRRAAPDHAQLFMAYRSTISHLNAMAILEPHEVISILARIR